MNKQEFLSILGESLEGEILPYQIEEHIRYYSEYISNTADGESEEERLNRLGDPRLIAKTIIEAATAGKSSFEKMSRDRSYTNYEEEEQTGSAQDFNRAHIKNYTWNAFTWYQKLLAVFIGVLIVIAVIGIILVGVNLFFSIVLPVLIIVFIVRLIMSMTRK